MCSKKLCSKKFCSKEFCSKEFCFKKFSELKYKSLKFNVYILLFSLSCSICLPANTVAGVTQDAFSREIINSEIINNGIVNSDKVNNNIVNSCKVNNNIINNYVDYVNKGCPNQECSENYHQQIARDYCQRLNKHVSLLKKFNEINQKSKILDLQADQSNIFSIKNIEFKKEIINICIASMYKQKSLDPFFKTWDYAYSLCVSNTDIEFVREFSIVIFSLYENIFVALSQGRQQTSGVKNANFLKMVDKKESLAGKESVAVKESLAENENKNALDDIMQVYNSVSSLPVREIIDALEKCYDVFSKILNEYRINSSMTAVQWLKSFWWLAPTIAIGLIVAYFRKKISNDIINTFEKNFEKHDEKS